MTKKILSLDEVSQRINERIGKFKLLSPETGYYIDSQRGKNFFWLEENKIRMNMAFEGTHQPTSFGYFKSKKGYNSKYKNNKQFANHYGEYISSIILKQLGKKACKVDLGVVNVTNPYSGKTLEVEGILSHYQLDRTEMMIPANVIIERFKGSNPKKYKELIGGGNSASENHYTNIEILLTAFEDTFRKSSMPEKVPEIRKYIFDMCAFDIKFGNRDRHDENLGLKFNQQTNKFDMYHLFDNEQILGMQENKSDIIGYLGDPKKFEKFKEKELTSCIGIPGAPQKIDPMELLKYLLQKYPEEMRSSLADIGRYTHSDLIEVMNSCEGLSEEHKAFASKIFLDREKSIQKLLEELDKSKFSKDDDELDL